MDGTGIKAAFEAKTAGRSFPDRVRLPLSFDPAPLRADLERFGEADWFGHTFRRNYEGDWSIVPLRAPAGETHPLRLIGVHPGASDYADTQWLDRAPALKSALDSFECPLRSVRLMRLSPGSRILEHDDANLDAESGRPRLHIVITTNAEVEFRLGGRPVAMEPGSCWYLKLSEPHQAANRGASDRVHLVIDAVTDDWLIGMLERGTGM